ncbi:MAG: hypothetical protein R3C99_22360 [Pirellulaceae bacterium]
MGLQGLTELNGVLYTVSSNGGLYRINNAGAVLGASATYVRTATDLVGINFVGLDAGPPNVEPDPVTGIGKYANLLFGIDANGRMYAFNTSGELQPIFLDGQTSVDTGVTNATGLQFSTLDQNLFHETPLLPNFESATAMDVRLGIAQFEGQTILVDRQQLAAGHGGRSSYHFGQGNVGGTPRTYDFPGGAHGSIVSNEFDLTGYTAADRPVLYFNYYLETQNDLAALTDPVPPFPMLDAFRVFVSDDSGDWKLLGTNNSARNGINEYDITPFEVQEFYDINDNGAPDSWRQVRIPLDEYAGRENLRLRFDFSTAGGMNVGDMFTTGDELRAVAGVYINDGDTLQIDNRTIEFDSGITLVMPSAAAIPLRDASGNPQRQTITITDRNGDSAKFEFVDTTDLPSDIRTVTGDLLLDGDVFTVGDGTTLQRFEIDTGLTLRVNALGGAAGGVANGDGFVINNPLVNSGDVEFEFDKDGVINSVNNPTIINIADDMTMLLPLAGVAGGIVDGNRFSISADNGLTFTTFEFDSNNSVVGTSEKVNIHDSLTIQVPAAGGGFNGIAAGGSFTIDDDVTDALPRTVFNFVASNPSANPLNIVVGPFTTQDELADNIVAAINAANLGLVAVNNGTGLVELTGTTPKHFLSTAGTPNLVQGRQPLTQTQLADRIVAAVNNRPALMLNPVNLNGDVVLLDTTPQHVLNTGGSTAIVPTTTPKTQDDIAARIEAAIRSQSARLGLDAFNDGNGVVQVFDPADPATQFNVTISSVSGLTQLGTPGVTAGAVRVPVQPSFTEDQVAVAIRDAITSSSLGAVGFRHQ